MIETLFCHTTVKHLIESFADWQHGLIPGSDTALIENLEPLVQQVML